MGQLPALSAKDRLAQLGLRTDPATVRSVVSHLSQRKSQYALYKGTVAVVSKVTARKIKRLWEEGKLSFLLDLPLAEKTIRQVFPLLAETDEQRRAREESEEQENIREEIEALKVPGARATDWDDPFRFARLKLVRGAEQLVLEAEWSIAGLEVAGVPQSQVLGLLLEYDALHIKRIVAEIHRSPPSEEWMMDFPGIDRYMALHYLVDFQRRHPGAPFEVVSIAADLCAKGILVQNNRYISAGEDLLRYEAWRGPEYQRAYFKALERYYGSTRALERFRAKVQAAMGVAEKQRVNDQGQEGEGEKEDANG